MKKQSYFVLPNWLEEDTRMYPSTKQVLCTMLAHTTRKHYVRKSLSQLAQLSGRCVSTVRQALAQLAELGLCKAVRRYRYSKRLGRMVRAVSGYYLRCCDVSWGYTLVPRSLLGEGLTAAQFCVALHQYRCAGRTGRSYRSLRGTARATDLSRATICRAVVRLCSLQVVIRLRCIMANRRCHSCNSYYPTDFVRARGGLIFSRPDFINKITKGLYWEEEDYGVAQFGKLTKNGRFTDKTHYQFNGTGVLVLPGQEELEML